MLIVEFADGRSTKARLNDDDAFEHFRRLSPKRAADLEVRAEFWVREGRLDPHWGHSWDANQRDGAYSDCYVFKVQDDRFYGVYFRPFENDRGFVAVVLLTHDHKSRQDTDFRKLDKAKRLISSPDVLDALRRYFGGGSNSGKTPGRRE